MVGESWERVELKGGRAGVCDFRERECISGEGVVRKCVKCESGDRVEHNSGERVERMG